ncbi:hypothetical protein GPB2148_166 [marine gamma proteobacterium HTCC2148]|nr:hypothetical protein GPB2148_166 [marine gamma proteobacterium HTCC2148]
MTVIEHIWPWPWWGVMVAINICNLAICIACFRNSLLRPDGNSTYVRNMRIMGLVFTLVALYRAVFVSRYLYQYAWFDTLANSSLIIRIFAWGAELSFAGLIAFAMLRFNRDMARHDDSYALSRYEKLAPYGLILCIFVAQFFATGGLITKSRLLFAIEESLWSAGFFTILPLAIIQFRRASKQALPSSYIMLRRSSQVLLSWCVIYCSYGLVYHLPTEYWATALEQLRTGQPQLKTDFSAIKDAFKSVNVTHHYPDWGFGFVLWHSAYFSVCVWLSIFLMRAPRYLGAEQQEALPKGRAH